MVKFPLEPSPIQGWLSFATFLRPVAEVPEEVHSRGSAQHRHGFVDAQRLPGAGHADDLNLLRRAGEHAENHVVSMGFAMGNGGDL